MEITNRGQTIILDVNTDDQQKAYELVCKCGHRLVEHASPIFWYSPDYLHHTIYTSQCTHWKDGVMPMQFCCEQFQLK
jgi:hypothetical protein